MFSLFEIRSEFVDRTVSVSHEWAALVADATQRALAKQHRLLIIDTFPGLAGLGDEQENDAGAITSRLRPLQMAAGKGLSVLFLHHMNNANQPRGSKAFRGVVDISIRFLRKAMSRSFRLETETRFASSVTSSVRAELIQAPDGWFYRPLDRGSASVDASSRSPDEVLWEAIKEGGEQGVTYAELSRIEGLSLDIAKRRLPNWRGEKRVGRDGTGVKGDPHRWYPCPTTRFGAVRESLKEVKTPNSQ
jgi:hypothetical protein